MAGKQLRIFDSHMHMGFWGSHVIQGRNINPFRGREMDSPQKVVACLNKNGVERAVVVPCYTPDKQQAYRINSLVLETAKMAAERIIPGLWVDPSPKLMDLLHATLTMAKENGIYVLKTSAETWDNEYSPDPASWDSNFSFAMKTILDYAKDSNSVIQIHAGSKKSDIRNIEKFIRFAGPNICFHLVHMGGSTQGHYYLIPRIMGWLLEGLNIVCDTSLASGFAVRWLLDIAAGNRLLSESIMFASDEPWGSFQSELSKVTDATEGHPDLLTAILWTNASRIYARQ